ncbi:MAG TPA: hypothetical protein PKK94_22820, partial [Leptospiraceae bacterium]|nr:hypothetical protein [Leptospiraceae bacterium]
SRDLQRDLNAGKTDYRNEVKGMIKEELFKYFANLISPSFPGIRNNDIIKFMKYDQNRRDSAEKERSAERRRQEIAAQTAAAAVLTFVPGAQGAAGAVFSGIVSALESVPVLGNLVTGMKWIIQGAAEYMAEAGSYLQSSIGIAASESAGAGAAGTAANSLTAQALQNYSSASILTSGLSAAADGNSEGVIAAAVNGLLLSFTGPAGGFAGHVSYTPPEKTDLLTGLLNKIDGASKPTSGWGGGFNFGGSIFNAGLTFTPGSGTSVDLGFSNGGQWNQSMFGNISYNINSGHTNGSIGLGQEYGTNLSANFSTVEAPSYTLSFGCDMQGDKGKTGTNCGGGGANKYGLGGSLTLTENGIDAGIDLLGNSFASSSYDRESGTWSDPEFDESWAYNVQQMSSQDLADEEINASARKTVFDEHYKKLLENDPSIAERLQAFLDGRKPGEDEYTALQSFYQDNRELAAQNGFNLPSDNKSSNSSIADAVYNASQIFLGALGISTLGLGLLNRTGAGTGGSPSPDPRSPIPETEVTPARRREEGEGGVEATPETPEGGGEVTGLYGETLDMQTLHEWIQGFLNNDLNVQETFISDLGEKFIKLDNGV